MAVEPPEPPWSTVMSVLPMMQVVLLEGDVEFVGHQLAETGSGALAEVRLADIKGGRVVLDE